MFPLFKHVHLLSVYFRFTLFSVTYYVCLYVNMYYTRMPARPRRIVCATIYYIDRSSSNTIEFQASVLRFLRSQPTTCLAGRPPHSLTSLARPPRAVGAGRVYYYRMKAIVEDPSSTTPDDTQFHTRNEARKT